MSRHRLDNKRFLMINCHIMSLLNPDFALDARTETQKAEAVSTQKVKVLLVAWTNFLRKKMSGVFRRIPRSNAKFGLNPAKAIGVFALTLLSTMAVAEKSDPRAEDVFMKFADQVVQIRVVEKTSGSKSTVGSGFFIGPGLVATNYHVVANLLWQPESYRAELVFQQGETHPVDLLRLDVVHDLAILSTKVHKPAFSLDPAEPPKGARLYAMGNPHDLGLTIIEGSYSGALKESLLQKIHFSGSVNPGMSGGPVLNRDGLVVGVCVQTAGEQVSFLVPVRFLEALLRAPFPDTSPDKLFEVIRGQLMTHQANTYAVITSSALIQTDLGKFRVPGRISPMLNCWGDSDDLKNQPYGVVHSHCTTNDSIFLRDGLDTGFLNYSHHNLTSKGLNMFQFVALQSAFIKKHDRDDLRGGNEQDFSRTECKSSLLRAGNVPMKTTVCMRAYVKFPGLYDVSWSAASLVDTRQGFTCSFRLHGVTMETADAFLKRVLESYQWNP